MPLKASDEMIMASCYTHNEPFLKIANKKTVPVNAETMSVDAGADRGNLGVLEVVALLVSDLVARSQLQPRHPRLVHLHKHK